RREHAGDKRDRRAPPSPGEDDGESGGAELVVDPHCEAAPSPDGGVVSLPEEGACSGGASRRLRSRWVRGAGRSLRGAMRSRLTRRGSASSTSTSKLPGPEISSPRTGRRPT